MRTFIQIFLQFTKVVDFVNPHTTATRPRLDKNRKLNLAFLKTFHKMLKRVKGQNRRNPMFCQVFK